MPITFPNVPRSQESFTLANAARVGGISLGGTQQVVTNPASLWKARLGIRMRKPEHFLAMRGFIAGIDGQAGQFYVGPVDWRGQPWYVDSLVGVTVTPGIAARSARADAGSATNPDSSGDLDFTLDQPVEMNSTVFNIRRTRGGLLRVGQYLQLGDRLHTIVALLTPDTPNSQSGLAIPGVVQVMVRPWTLRAFNAGSVLAFKNPVCLMRLADPEVAVEMTTSPVGDLTLNLVEA